VRLGRLPHPVTALIGREADIRAVERLLDEHRLVTLTGAGGSGKTRMAIEVAARVRDRLRDGAIFVPLQDTRDRAGVLMTIADALGVQERGGIDLVDGVEGYLADREVLLVLDNFEQVIAAAPLVTGFLEAAPELRVIVTSRTPLRIAGEQESEVAPLDAEAAMRVFIERATAVRPTFDASEHEAGIAAIVRRVDGLPLAVELAAAQIRHLTPETILARLQGSLPVLVSGQRDAPARQRTQRATLDWSHDLLSAETRLLFASLSVFEGGWTLDAAEQLCGDAMGGPDAVFEGLSELVEASLVRTGEPGAQRVRYSMHQLTREYAADRLARMPERDDIERRHAAWVLGLVEMAEPHLMLRDLRDWQERLKTEEDNIRRALRWTIDHGATDLGLRIAGACWRFWYHWAALREGVAWLQAVLALPGAETPGEPRARALSSLAALWWHQGRFGESLEAYLEVVSIVRSLGIEGEPLGDALDDASWAAWLIPDVELDMRLTEEKWRYPRRAHSYRFDGWIGREIEIAMHRMQPGTSEGDYLSVMDALETILEDVDHSDQALFAAHLRATIAAFQGLFHHGDRGYRRDLDALRIYRELGHRGQVPIMLLTLASYELRLGRPARALRLAAAAGRESAAVGGTVVSERDWSDVAQTETRAAALLPADEAARIIREGRAMSTDEAIAYALEESPEDRPVRAAGRRRHDLTPREQEVLAMVADGRTDGEIAEALVISKKTASVHVASIKAKLGAATRAEIVAMALRGGLVRAD
jgi:predicted ATPase/DNA-binding CsgD family transcriptional regulator